MIHRVQKQKLNHNGIATVGSGTRMDTLKTKILEATKTLILGNQQGDPTKTSNSKIGNGGGGSNFEDANGGLGTVSR